MNRIRIPAGTGKAFEVPAGNLVEIIATEGPPVAATWAFALPGLDEFVSTEHPRSCLDRLSPRVGDAFYSNPRRPMLTVVADTSSGHPSLLPPAFAVSIPRPLRHQGFHAHFL